MSVWSNEATTGVYEFLEMEACDQKKITKCL